MKYLYNIHGILCFFILLIFSCQTPRFIPINQRKIDPKIGSINSINLDNNNDTAELHLKKKEIKIKPINEYNDTGSLFVKNNPNNYLFLSKTPLNVGDYVTIKVLALKRRVQSTNNINDSNSATNQQSEQASDIAQAADNNSDKSLEDMIQSFPNLAPENSNTRLLKQFKMRVTQIDSNGDVYMMLERNSINQNGSKNIQVKAKLSLAKYLAKDEITTEDIFDINWLENDSSNITERYSYQWEDEYTLRLSGFTETKSRLAQQLEEQRKYLASVRDKLRNQVISLNKERQTMNKERAKLLKDKQDAENKIKELEAALKQYEYNKQTTAKLSSSNSTIIENESGSSNTASNAKPTEINEEESQLSSAQEVKGNDTTNE